MADPTPQEGVEQIEQAAAEIPSFVAEKFRTAENPIEAQARSYAEAEREMSRLRSESERKDREFAEALQRIESTQQQQAQPVFNPSTDPLLQAAQNAYDSGDVTTLLAIQAQISQAATAQMLDQRLGEIKETLGGATAQDREMALRMAEQQVKPLYGDRWDTDIAPKLNERMGALPATPSVEGYAQFLREQAQIVDYPRLQAQLEAAEADRQAKLQAQTLAGGTARVTLQAPPNEKAWAEIKAADAGGWSGVVGG